MGGAAGTKIASFALSALAILGFVVACRRRLTVAEPLVVMALGIIVLWPFWTFLHRTFRALGAFGFGHATFALRAFAFHLALFDIITS